MHYVFTINWVKFLIDLVFNCSDETTNWVTRDMLNIHWQMKIYKTTCNWQVAWERKPRNNYTIKYTQTFVLSSVWGLRSSITIVNESCISSSTVSDCIGYVVSLVAYIGINAHTVGLMVWGFYACEDQTCVDKLHVAVFNINDWTRFLVYRN